MNKARELGKSLIDNIPKPAMCENCGEGENYYMANCLHYYVSHQLDSIAKEAYKKHLKMESNTSTVN